MFLRQTLFAYEIKPLLSYTCYLQDNFNPEYTIENLYLRQTGIPTLNYCKTVRFTYLSQLTIALRLRQALLCTLPLKL